MLEIADLHYRFTDVEAVAGVSLTVSAGEMSLGDQVAYFARLHGLDDAQAQRAAGAWLERLGLGQRRADKLVSLSHGNQQRVQLAVALVHDPAVLVLDELFAGLDLGRPRRPSCETEGSTPRSACPRPVL